MEEGYLRLSQADSRDEEVLVRLSGNNTVCHMSARVLKHEHKITPEHLSEILEAKRIVYGIDSETLADICERANSGKPVQDELVAKGRPAVTGKDGYFEFFIKPFSAVPEYDERENGQIDFHETHLFENVKEGQAIGRIVPPCSGEPGMTVLGDKIPVAKVKKCPLRPGQGVRREEADDVFVATQGGRVMQKFDTLLVTEELLIDKDVNFKIGHIDFVGFVQIRCDVLEGFNVRAKKGLQIAGNVSNSVIQSEGDITLGGMSSREGEGFIYCGGNLKANYLCNVHVECEGSIVISREAVNCAIACNGSLTVQGRMVGGKYMALGGIEAGQIGTEIGVKTFLTCGDDYHYLKDIEDFKSQLHDSKMQLRKAEEEYQREFKDMDIASLPEEQMHRHEMLSYKVKKARQLKLRLQDSLRLIRQASREKSNAKINVLQRMYAGTHMILDCAKEDAKEEREGPFTAISDKGQTVVYRDYTDLSINARALEPSGPVWEECAVPLSVAPNEPVTPEAHTPHPPDHPGGESQPESGEHPSGA